MILLNTGLTDVERDKVMRPYSGNSLGHDFSYEDAGRGVGAFVAENRNLLLETAALLDQAHANDTK